MILNSSPKRRRGKRASGKGKKKKRSVSSESSSSGGRDESGSTQWGKGIKPDPFPKSVPPTEMNRRWREWKTQFMVVLELRGRAKQRQKALLLFASVGAEVQKIITQNQMLGKPSEDKEGSACFDELVRRLDKYFAKFSDPGVEIKVFNEMKQGTDETAHGFHQRLVEQANICGIASYEQLFRARLIEGLRDRRVTEHAYMTNASSKLIIDMATRNEARQVVAKPDTAAGASLESQVRAEDVAAVTERKRGSSDGANRRFQPYERRSGGNMRGSRSEHPPWRGRDRRDAGRGRARGTGVKAEGPEPSKACGRCKGTLSHYDGRCRAAEMKCYACARKGHIAVACREKSVNAVEGEAAGARVKDEVTEWMV